MSGRNRFQALLIAASAALATSGVALPAAAIAAPRPPATLQDCYRLGYDEGVRKGSVLGYAIGYKEGYNYTEKAHPPEPAPTPKPASRRGHLAAAPAQPPQCVGNPRYDKGQAAGREYGYADGYGTGWVAGYNAASKK